MPRLTQSSGLFIPPTDYTDSVRQVVMTLQARIQQLMLDQALMERDQRGTAPVQDPG